MLRFFQSHKGLLTAFRRIKIQLKSQEDAHQRQLETARREAQKAADKIHEEHRAKEEELQRQLEYVKKTAEATTTRAQRRAETELVEAKRKSEAELAEAKKKSEAEVADIKKAAEAQTTRAQRRAEADMADLRATISRFETDLMKVRQLSNEYWTVLLTDCTRQTRQRPTSFDLPKMSMLQLSRLHKKHIPRNSTLKPRGLLQPRPRLRQRRTGLANLRSRSRTSRSGWHKRRLR